MIKITYVHIDIVLFKFFIFIFVELVYVMDAPWEVLLMRQSNKLSKERMC